MFGVFTETPTTITSSTRFTLIELLVVIAIIAIFDRSALPCVSRSAGSSQENTGKKLISPKSSML